MRLPILVAVCTALAAAAIWLAQSRQLANLSAYADVLRSENRTIAETGSDAVPAGAPARLVDHLATGPVIVGGGPDVDAASILDFIATLDPGTPEGQEQAVALLDQLSSAPASTLRAIVDLAPAHGLDDEARLGITGIALSRLAELGDGPFAAEMGSELTLPPSMVSSIIASWTTADPGAAAEWLISAKLSGTHTNDFLDAAESAILQASPPAALSATIEKATAATGAERSAIVREAARRLSTDAEWLGFARAIVAIKDEELREQAITALTAGSMDNPHFSDTRDLVDQLTAHGSLDSANPDWMNPFVLGAATREFDQTTPERANWLIDRSAPEHLHANIDHLVSAWTATDFNAVASWLKSLAPSTARDTAVESFAKMLAPHEPAPALEWAMTIGDDATKQSVVSSIIAAWQASDPAAAAEFARESGH